MMGTIYPQIPVPAAADVQAAFQSGAPGAFLYWIKYSAESPDFSVRDVFGLLSGMSDAAVLDGYEAPFPDEAYAAGARKFPSLVPVLPEHKSEREKNDAAWEVLRAFDRPVLTGFSDDDPVTRGGEKRFQDEIPGAKGVQHVTIHNGGHFLQEMQPGALSEAIISFMRTTR